MLEITLVVILEFWIQSLDMPNDSLVPFPTVVIHFPFKVQAFGTTDVFPVFVVGHVGYIIRN